MSREERICWEHINKFMFTSYCFMACMVQLREYLYNRRSEILGWYLESNSVSLQDKAAKRKEAMWCEDWSLSGL